MISSSEKVKMLKIQFLKRHVERFKKLDILAIYLFGSQAEGNIHPLSDVDLGVVFENPQKYIDKTMSPYIELYQIFTEVLPKDYLRRRFKTKEHEFDLVFLQFAPIHIQFNAIRNAKVLFESRQEKRLDYEEYVLKRHCDLKYLYDLRENAILERI
jgi:predicted nucleotidyltransferase